MSGGHILRPEEIAAAAAMQGPSPDTVMIIEALGGALSRLEHQLDILIRLECGQLKRADVKERIETLERMRAAQQNGGVSAEAALEVVKAAQEVPTEPA